MLPSNSHIITYLLPICKITRFQKNTVKTIPTITDRRGTLSSCLCLLVLCVLGCVATCARKEECTHKSKTKKKKAFDSKQSFSCTARKQRKPSVQTLGYVFCQLHYEL